MLVEPERAIKEMYCAAKQGIYAKCGTCKDLIALRADGNDEFLMISVYFRDKKNDYWTHIMYCWHCKWHLMNEVGMGDIRSEEKRKD